LLEVTTVLQYWKNYIAFCAHACNTLAGAKGDHFSISRRVAKVIIFMMQGKTASTHIFEQPLL